MAWEQSEAWGNNRIWKGSACMVRRTHLLPIPLPLQCCLRNGHSHARVRCVHVAGWPLRAPSPFSAKTNVRTTTHSLSPIWQHVQHIFCIMILKMVLRCLFRIVCTLYVCPKCVFLICLEWLRQFWEPYIVFDHKWPFTHKTTQLVFCGMLWQIVQNCEPNPDRHFSFK